MESCELRTEPGNRIILSETYYTSRKGRNALNKWPKHVVWIAVDARGVRGSKENPAVEFEYEKGYIL